ncbi:3-oxoacyl-[acyl-carrier-protein] synthase I, chloroplastic-like [Rutidosis leptorrhynchoides]|uniref:3-oxoacyl-[acyl-carrier-protein] synthase I, chloroplastic-like n=1 Tax=Rutidosis leptorrhynchoides TaxID=125765 RepID=UPI003A99DA91
MEAKTHLLPTPSFRSPLINKSRPQITIKGTQVLHASHVTVTAPKREKDAKKRVVITGMGVVSVFGNDVDMFYKQLLDGVSGIGLIDSFDPSDLTTRFAGQMHGFVSNGYIDPKHDMRLDNCQRYCIVAGKKALEDAGLAGQNSSKINKERAGVLIGSAAGGVTVFSNGMECLIKKGCSRISPYLSPLVLCNMGSALLAVDIGFTGPNYSVSASCATSNYCFFNAANHIREGRADLIIAGGSDAPIIPIVMGGFAATKGMSQRNDDPQTACRPWDKDRDGFVLGEGSGVLVMESLDHAMKRDAPILAEYLGGAINCDAYHITCPRSDGHIVTSCIQSCLVNAGVSAEEVNYVNAHATSTLHGDLAEVSGLKNVFKNTTRIKMNATKSMIGHCMGAAGGLEAIATIKAIQTGWLHPTINQLNIEPVVEFDTVANKKKHHEINVAISNSMGIGGHNSIVAFSPFEP